MVEHRSVPCGVDRGRAKVKPAHDAACRSTFGPVILAGRPAFSRYAQAFGIPRRVHGLATLSVSAGRSGADKDARLELLRRQYPRWSIWRGAVTGDYWAMPPRGHPTRRELISARDLEDLAQSLAEAEEQHDL